MASAPPSRQGQRAPRAAHGPVCRICQVSATSVSGCPRNGRGVHRHGIPRPPGLHLPTCEGSRKLQESVYAKCMAVKTITIDLEAYDRLSRLKDGDSFSQVIKKYLPAVGSTAGDLLVALDGSTVSDETVDRIAEAVEGRRHSPVREPSW